MATDFTYDNKTINSSGGFKPSGKNMPIDARTRVNTFADIASIPVPYVGMIITVLQDETNSNKMTDYKVKSLKANSLGSANSLVDEVVRYIDYLGAGSVSIGGSLVTRDIEDGEILTVSNEIIPVIAYGNIITSAPTISINEGEEYEFTVRISPAPTVDQQVTISVNNGNCTVDRTSLTFTSNNYSVPQTVKVTGTHNSTDYTNLTSVISLASTKVETKKINVTVVNIDDPNPLNTISAVYNQGDTKVYPDTSLNDLKSNLVVTAHYSDNSTQTVTDYSLSGTLTEGTSTITVTYREKTTTFNVTVTARPTLNTISAVYTQGDTKVYTTNSLDSLKSNLVVTARYSDNSTQTVTDYSLSGTLTEGTSTITVTYREKTTTFNVTVTARPTLNTISAVYTQGDTKVYTTNSLDSLKSNLVVTAHYNDGSTQTVTDYVLSGTLTEGTSTITVTYREKTTTFNVTVTASETPVLTGITSEFNQGYTKVYTISSVNSLKNNLVVTANYNDDSTQTVTDYTLSGTLTEGTSTITVTYEDKTDTFDVNVEVLEINENSNAYIKDGYLYLNTASINRAGVNVRNNATTPDPNHQYFAFKTYTGGGYSPSELTDEIVEKLHNNVIEFAGNCGLDGFNSGNIECADFAYINYRTTLFYRIPTSAYEAAGNDIINGLANAIPMLPTLINPNKTLTIYTITDEIIDTITTGNTFDIATTEGESHTGFLTLDPNISGIKENLKCETSLGGAHGSLTINSPMDNWYTNVGGGRLNYSIPYGKIPGNTVDDIKAYLKANRLIFYKFN